MPLSQGCNRAFNQPFLRRRASRIGRPISRTGSKAPPWLVMVVVVLPPEPPPLLPPLFTVKLTGMIWPLRRMNCCSGGLVGAGPEHGGGPGIGGATGEAFDHTVTPASAS